MTDNVLTRDTETLFEGSETVACNLLLVEDDALSRRNLAIFFQQSEQNVHEADTGEIAVELIDRITFDVVVSDFRLPGRLRGVDVLRHHFRHFPEKRRILVTAFGSDQLRLQAENLHAHYFEKPVSLNHLLQTLLPAT